MRCFTHASDIPTVGDVFAVYTMSMKELMERYSLLEIAVALFVVVGLAVFLAMRPVQQPVAQDSVPTGPPPAMTEEEQAIVENSKGAVALISYTDNGFEPAETTVRVGDTVRFFNSSSEDLWVAAVAVDGAIYPGSSESCGQSQFDTCHSIEPRHFWEFTFDTPGTWTYQNNANTKNRGLVITVI
jgi:plastocyanin